LAQLNIFIFPIKATKTAKALSTKILKKNQHKETNL